MRLIRASASSRRSRTTSKVMRLLIAFITHWPSAVSATHRPMRHSSGQMTSKRTAPAPTIPSMARPTSMGTVSVSPTVAAESSSDSSTSQR